MSRNVSFLQNLPERNRNGKLFRVIKFRIWRSIDREPEKLYGLYRDTSLSTFDARRDSGARDAAGGTNVIRKRDFSRERVLFGREIMDPPVERYQ